MNALKVIADVQAVGGSLHIVQPDRLRVRAPRPLPAYLVDRVKESKADIIALLIKPTADPDTFAERAAIIQSNNHSIPWADGFAKLCTMPRPAVYSPQRWQQIIDDGGHFLDTWGRQAAALGWKALDVFGVNPDAPEWRYDGMGLVPLIEGQKIVAITANTARLACHDGAMLTYYRKQTLQESIAIWNLK